MPLRDHFRGLLAVRRSWTAFHSAWATYLAEALNEDLPAAYFAEPNVQFAIEIDVATWEEVGGPARQAAGSGEAWSPAPPQLTVPLTLVTDVVEVQIVRNEGGPVLAGAMELISPANKDRPASREAFVSKCAAYVQQGIGLVMTDVVTEQSANLHRELLARIDSSSQAVLDADLYAGSYRPVSREKQPLLDVWYEPLQLGVPLPTLPLWLRGGLCFRLDLEATYERTIRKMRFPPNGG
jgi:hypothetical protein